MRREKLFSRTTAAVSRESRTRTARVVRFIDDSDARARDTKHRITIGVCKLFSIISMESLLLCQFVGDLSQRCNKRVIEKGHKNCTFPVCFGATISISYPANHTQGKLSCLVKSNKRCARGDTICPRPSPPRVGAVAPRAAEPSAAPADGNVAAVSHAQYVPTVTAVAACA